MEKGKCNGVVDGVVSGGVGRGIFREIGTWPLRYRCVPAALPLCGSEPALRLAEGRRGPDQAQPVIGTAVYGRVIASSSG